MSKQLPAYVFGQKVSEEKGAKNVDSNTVKESDGKHK